MDFVAKRLSFGSRKMIAFLGAKSIEGRRAKAVAYVLGRKSLVKALSDGRRRDSHIVQKQTALGQQLTRLE